MNGFYKITEAIRYELIKQGFKVVTIGDYVKVDLEKQTIFPLAHIVPQTSSLGEITDTFIFNIVGMDVVDFNKEDPRQAKDRFFGTDNMQDVLNDIHNRLNNFKESFSRGDNFDLLIQALETSNSLEPFFERFENILAGWELTITITIPSGATIC